MSERLKALADAGVSIWLDDLSRERIESGNLADLVKEKSVVGVTTNPTIFAGAIADGERYDEQVRRLVGQGEPVDRVIFELTTEGTMASARALWSAVQRPNALIKIPATKEGLPAITAAVAEGISVNVTLIFGLQRYQEVMDAYLTGLEQARDAGLDLSSIQSVASFFVSRVDTEVDARLDAIGTDEARALKGKAALANARLAFAAFEEVVASDRWEQLAQAGAHRQRPLWASTGVKSKDYPDTLYVSELVVADTVNTMPEKTMEAFADHGEVTGDTVTGRGPESQEVFDRLEAAGVDFLDVLVTLEHEGVDKFKKSWTELVETVRGQMEKAGRVQA